MLLNLMLNTAVLPGADIILDMHQVTFDFSSFTQEQKEPRGQLQNEVEGVRLEVCFRWLSKFMLGFVIDACLDPTTTVHNINPACWKWHLTSASKGTSLSFHIWWFRSERPVSPLPQPTVSQHKYQRTPDVYLWDDTSFDSVPVFDTLGWRTNSKTDSWAPWVHYRLNSVVKHNAPLTLYTTDVLNKLDMVLITLPTGLFWFFRTNQQKIPAVPKTFPKTTVRTETATSC